MADYIVTFFTHYDALVCQKLLGGYHIDSRLAPVPRRLSSSCGTCLLFSSADFAPTLLEQAEIEKLVRAEGERYTTLIDRM